MDSPFKTVLAINGTVIPLVLHRQEVWFFTGMHLFFKFCNDAGIVPTFIFTLGVEPWKMMAATSSMLSFFIVFFISQCFARFTHLYDACTKMGGMIQVIASITSVQLEADNEARWQGLRYLCAAVLILYANVNDGDVSKQSVDPHEWARIMSVETVKGVGPGGSACDILCPPLLTETEVARLKEFAGPKFVPLITWTLHVYRKSTKAVGGTEMMFLQLQAYCFELRAACATVTNTLSLPVPFAYYHLLLLLQYFSYTTIAMTLVAQESWWTPIVFFCIILGTSGVREVACAMSDPFGDDETDLPVEQFVRQIRGFVSVYGKIDTRPPSAKSGGSMFGQNPAATPVTLPAPGMGNGPDKPAKMLDCLMPGKRPAELI